MTPLYTHRMGMNEENGVRTRFLKNREWTENGVRMDAILVHSFPILSPFSKVRLPAYVLHSLHSRAILAFRGEMNG